MSSDIARSAVGAGNAVVIEQRRLHRQTIVLAAAVGALAVESEKNVEGVKHFPQPNLAEQAPGAVLRNGIPQRTHAVRDVVHRARVRWIGLCQRKRLAE